jgi:acyl carrier protein
MNKNDFFSRLENDFELDVKINDETNLKELAEWDSLASMILISIVNEEYEIVLNNEDIENITTVKSLMERIGMGKFN